MGPTHIERIHMNAFRRDLPRVRRTGDLGQREGERHGDGHHAGLRPDVQRRVRGDVPGEL